MHRSTVPGRRRRVSAARRISRPSPRRRITLSKMPRRRTAAAPKRGARPPHRAGLNPARVTTAIRSPQRRLHQAPTRPIRVFHQWPYRWRSPHTVTVRDGGGLPGSAVYLPSDIALQARRALRDLGIGGPLWVNRLRRADRRLIVFINRFYLVEGFEHAVRLYFDGVNQRRAARIVIRLAQRLAERNGRLPTNMRLYPTMLVGSNGRLEPSVVLVHKMVHYLALPWSRLTRSSVRRLMVRLVQRFEHPSRVRLVFDQTWLPYDRADLIRRLRRMLDSPNRPRRRWVDALPDMVYLQ